MAETTVNDDVTCVYVCIIIRKIVLEHVFFFVTMSSQLGSCIIFQDFPIQKWLGSTLMKCNTDCTIIFERKQWRHTRSGVLWNDHDQTWSFSLTSSETWYKRTGTIWSSFYSFIKGYCEKTTLAEKMNYSWAAGK